MVSVSVNAVVLMGIVVSALFTHGLLAQTITILTSSRIDQCLR